MNTIQKAASRLLRGPRIAALLEASGIDPRRYWLLVDLFAELSDRGEMLDQLGRNRVSLKVISKIYFGLSVLLTFIFAAVRMPVASYMAFFLFFNGIVLLSALLIESANSLINPVEGLVLAHQPINGATYTGAKLTHLIMVLLYLVPGLNIAPALGGLALKTAGWWYPLAHLFAAFAIGIGLGLSCCAVFGWLLRFLPARRLRTTAQVIGALPLLGMQFSSSLRRVLAHTNVEKWLPQSAAVRWGIAAAVIALAAAGVIGGLRSLSADFLIRASSIVGGGSQARGRSRRSFGMGMIANLWGGQSARAGAAFLAKMGRRDWHFRRQLIPTLVPFAALFATAIGKWRMDPFSRQFAYIHGLPHAFGFLLLFVCLLLPYGSDYKAIWFFLTVPTGALRGFARGVWASLWLNAIVIPHLVLLIPVAAAWGVAHAALFIAYSAAVASLYLSLELRIVESIPFMRQPDTARGAGALLLMMAAGTAGAILMALQYFLLFRFPAAVAGATVVSAVAAWALTRSSLIAFTAAMRYKLSLLSVESGTLYHEIES